MGMGSYSTSERSKRSEKLGYKTKSVQEIFSQHTINSAMNPHGVRLRESRDSIEHPNTVSIVLALDVTGSMGSIPHHLVKEGLPYIMGNILQSGIKDPQLLFLAVGDHECDSCPLQVVQFESSDELLDTWLTRVFLEGGGGGNAGESYLLAWYFAGFHTALDSVEKRQQKGFLFTVGDEPTLKSIPAKTLKNIMGDGQYQNYSALELLDKARQFYHVYHLHIKETGAGSSQTTINGWKQIMGEHLIVVDRHEQISTIIPEIVAKNSLNLQAVIQTTETTPTQIIL
jgi:hypothetical protein